MTQENIDYMNIISRTYSYADIVTTEGVSNAFIKKLGKDVWDNPDYVIHIGGTERFTPLFYEEIIVNRERGRGKATRR